MPTPNTSAQVHDRNRDIACGLASSKARGNKHKAATKLETAGLTRAGPCIGTRTTLDDYLYQRPVSLLLVMCSGDSKPLHFVRQSRTLQSCSEPRQLPFRMEPTGAF